jgi:carbamoyltransferase
MPDYTLALHPATDGFGSHDPSAVVFADGELAFGVEEERLVREKHAPGRFPARAVRACLRHCGIDLSDVDRVAVPWGGRTGTAQDGPASPATDPIDPVERRLRALDRGVPARIERYDHHRCHAASAFYPSGFDEAVVLTLDGRGNRWSTAVWAGDDEGLRRLAGYAPPNSLGYFYAAVTAYLGFEPFGGEGKLMGLAAYGERDRAIESRLRSVVDTGVGYDVTDLVGGGVPSAVGRLERLFGRAFHRPPDPSDRWATNLAHVAQALLEETAVALVADHCERQGLGDVCLAGGVALNCALNGRVAQSGPVERLFVQPVAHDAGAPIGAGLVAVGAPRTPLRTVSLGPSFPPDAVERALGRRGLDYTHVPDTEGLVGLVADRLADGALVGWFQGRAELGPRALGNRSVLADPRSRDAAARVNAFVKRREAWRPLAPSLPASAADRYLESPRDAPFMIDRFAVPPARRAEIPAVVHPADGTTRPQTVDPETHPLYHRLIEAFGDRTGVPVLLNTSFNRRGEPIVTTPDEALDAFAGTALELLVVEGFVVDA